MNQATPGKTAGLIESAVMKLFTRSATVLDIEEVGAAFRIVTLGGPALRDTGWTPGDKIQLQFGGWVQRTYTPIDWDMAAGRTRILVYLLAGGPGAQWGRNVQTGDECIVFGPRKSVRIARPQSPVILCGDETSLGLAAALTRRVPAPVHTLFEVSSLADTQPVLERLQLANARVCARTGSEEHLPALETQMAALLRLRPSADIVLTGKAGTIQHLGRALRQAGVAAGRRQSKAYWAPGKTGLD